jgi:predicted nucleic acid-binding protein
VVPTLDRTLETALDLATEHRLQIFDAIILAASAEAGCRMLLTQDMQDGFVWRGMTVANPFAATLHSLLADLLRQ